MDNNIKPSPPSKGYILPIWNATNSYRASAAAYCDRENIKKLDNSNGHTYSIDELKTAML